LPLKERTQEDYVYEFYKDKNALIDKYTLILYIKIVKCHWAKCLNLPICIIIILL